MKPKVIIVSGPTAIGKTKLGIDLALKFNGEIVNFDSLLFYQELNIGTAKPTIDEMQNVTHHLINIQSIANPLNAARFREMANELIKKLHQQNKLVILVGGSGFYLQALLKGMYDSPTTPETILNRSNKLYQESGIEPFREILQIHDPKNYHRLHSNDHYRIRRAVEHFWSHGTAFSQMQTQHLIQENLVDWDIFHCYIDMPKEEHWPIIQKRTDTMIQAGLVEEVQHLLKSFSGKEKPLQSIGYKETIEFLKGEIKSFAELKEKINIATRQLAKSQRTWFKKVERSSFHPIREKTLLLEQIKQFLEDQT